MERRNLEKAIDIYARLMMGEEIRRDSGANRQLYEEYAQNPEVCEVLDLIMKRLNLSLYEHNNGLYMTAGEGNRVFGYSNEECKRMMGLRYNRELYLVYFIMYQLLLTFYKDTGSYQFVEYTTLPELLERTTGSLKSIMMELEVMVQDEMEEHSFRTLALLWDELPLNATEELQGYRASRSCRTGMVKLTLNFMKEQNLLVEAQENYYPTDRFKALAEHYFEENRGRLYEILKKAGPGKAVAADAKVLPDIPGETDSYDPSEALSEEGLPIKSGNDTTTRKGADGYATDEPNSSQQCEI